MNNDGTRQNNNWDDEVQSDIYDTEEPRPRRRRLPPEQPAQPQQRVRRPRPTTESRQSSSPRPRTTTNFGQAQDSQGPQRPRTTTNFGQAQGSQRPRTYTDEEQQQRERPRSSADVPQSPRPRSTTGTRSRQAQPRPRAAVSDQRQQSKRRPRRVWPWLLVGCFGGILLVVLGIGIAAYLAVRNATGGGTGIGGIGGTSTYTQPSTQSVPLTSITQLQIHNQIGNVTITVDPNTTAPTVSTTKIVKANSQSDANSQFNAITVQVEPAGTAASTLAVNASVSNNSNLFANHNASVNIVVTLPPSVNTGNAPVLLNAGNAPNNITSVGNATISGLNGMLNVKNDIGNITVQNATLSPGSTLQTGTGNVTFNGTMDTTSGSSNNQSIYTISSEAGNLDVTLPAGINVTLDAYTNTGNITSDFDLSRIKQPDGSYSGPLLAGSSPNALLKLHVSTGNVTLHKA